MDSTVPADHRFEGKEGEKLNKYLDLTKEVNMRVKVITFVSVSRILVKWVDELEIRRRIETIQTTHDENRLGWLEESWSTVETYYLLVLSENLWVRAGVKNSQGVQ